MPKLKRFKKNKISTKNVLISFAIIMGIMMITIISKSYAIYKLEKKYDLIQSKIGTYTMGDVRVAVLVDGKEASEFPSYETNYKVEGIECTNGVTASFDVENWQINIADMSSTSTKCTVSFNSKETNEIKPVNMSKTQLLALNEEIKNTSAKELADYLYPVGSIYMSTSDDTVEKVQNKFGGTWVKYAEDMTLVGASETKEANSTGGSSTTVLTNENMPEHSHVIPSLKVSTWSGYHNHKENNRLWANYTASNNRYIATQSVGQWFNSVDEGVSALYTGNTTITVSGQTTTESNTTTCTNCSATPINVQNPYVAVYMYKRVS